MALSYACKVALLTSKFRGGLVGALLGDCVGNAWARQLDLLGEPVTYQAAASFLRRLKEENYDRVPRLPYSESTKTIYSVAGRLMPEKRYATYGVDWDDIDQKFSVHSDTRTPQLVTNLAAAQVLARSFHTEAYAQTLPKVESPVGVTPIAMFHYDNIEKAIQVSEEVTMGHSSAHDSILHCLAIHLSQQTDLPLNDSTFVDEMERLLDQTSRNMTDETLTLCVQQVRRLRDFLRQSDSSSLEQSLDHLGEAVLELDPAACSMFIFLKSLEANKTEKKSVMEKTLGLTLATSKCSPLHASLSSSLTGTYLGIESVPRRLRERCHGERHAVKTADQLAQIFNQTI